MVPFISEVEIDVEIDGCNMTMACQNVVRPGMMILTSLCWDLEATTMEECQDSPSVLVKHEEWKAVHRIDVGWEAVV